MIKIIDLPEIMNNHFNDTRVHSIYNYSKIISDDDWGLLEITPNKIEPKNDIIKLYEEEKEEDIKPKNLKIIDTNSHIRKNILKGFGSI